MTQTYYGHLPAALDIDIPGQDEEGYRQWWRVSHAGVDTYAGDCVKEVAGAAWGLYEITLFMYLTAILYAEFTVTPPNLNQPLGMWQGSNSMAWG